MEIQTILWAFIVISVASLAYAIWQYFSSNKKITYLRDDLFNTQEKLETQHQKQTELVHELVEVKNNYKKNFLYDPGTGLAGRQVFEDWLAQTLHQSKRYDLHFAVVLLDIDDFKTISSVVSDESLHSLLTELAERLKECIRKVDTVSRLAPEEFAFILPQLAKPETAAYVTQRVLEAVAKPFMVNNQELFITGSLGVATYPVDGSEAKILLKHADIALHQAKAKGGNRYQFYSEELFHFSQKELILNSCLRSEEVFKEFILYYQPQVSVDTHTIVCMEALVRWQHPHLGLIAPQEFLRLAENNNRIIAIGEWVLEKACAQLVTWRENGFVLPCVAVNVSMKQLEHSNFPYKVSKILQDLKLRPEDLILEISESVLMPKIELIEKTFNMLKHLGVRIAIDDFGTAYLSLQHLRRFPIDYLKIDNTLTRDVTLNKESEAIVKMIIALATVLNIVPIAEGIETEKQRDLIRALGCHLMQGYLFSPPFLPQDFTQKSVVDIQEHA